MLQICLQGYVTPAGQRLFLQSRVRLRKYPSVEYCDPASGRTMTFLYMIWQKSWLVMTSNPDLC